MAIRQLKAVALIAFALPASATPPDPRAGRQAMIIDLLTVESAKNIAKDRIACLAGEKARSIARARAIGVSNMPAVADYCTAVLARSVRDGARTLLRDSKSSEPTAATAIDTGFVTAHLENKPTAIGLPLMEVLMPIADRCLANSEPRVRLCYATGYALGQRVSRGEKITAR